MEIKITKSEEKECDENYIKNIVLEIQNELKKFFEEKDIEIKIFFSKEKYKMEIKERHIKPSEISSYILYEKKINLFAPQILKTIYRDSLNEKLKKSLKENLLRFYLCQKYYPCEEKINPYHHFLYEHFSKVISENFREKIAIFEIDNFKEKNYHNQDEKCFLFFYIVLKRIGEEYLFENLDVFFEDLDIEKSIQRLFKKSYLEFIKQFIEDRRKDEKYLRKLH